jgi:hypothetical protein
MTYRLFIDDERFPPDSDNLNWKIARDWDDVQTIIEQHGMPTMISFDHDLGDYTYTGYDITKFLVELDMDGNMLYQIPDEFLFYVHSQNPIGKRNIESYLNNYLKVRRPDDV